MQATTLAHTDEKTLVDKAFGSKLKLLYNVSFN